MNAFNLSGLIEQPDGTPVQGFEVTVKTASKTRQYKGQWKQNVLVTDGSGAEVWASFDLEGNIPIVRNSTLYIIEGKMGSFVNRKDNSTQREITVAKFSKNSANEPPAKASPYGKNSDMSKADWAEKDKQMARMCALNNATNKICTMATILNTAGDEEKILELATKFFNWVRNGEPTQTDSTEQMASVTQTAKDTDNVEDDIPF